MVNNIESRENDPAIKEARYIEELLKGYTYEVGTILDKSGDALWQGHGEYAEVKVPPYLVKGNIFTHNHPMGGTFTPPDIQNIIIAGGLEVRASTPGNETYSLRLSETVDPKLAVDYNNLVTDNMGSVYSYTKSLSLGTKEEENMVYAQKMTEICSPWLLENAHKYGCIYNVERKG